MKRILIALFCLAGVAAAQTTTPPPEGEKRQWLQEVIDVKYADPAAFEKLLRNIAVSGPDRVSAQPELHAISIGTYDPSFLKLAEEIVKRYDIPEAKSAASHRHGVEIVAHILLAGQKGTSGDAVPADLEPVAKQLRSVFGYTDIRVLDSSLIRGIEGRISEVSGMLTRPVIDEGLKAPSKYVISTKNILVEQNAGGNSVYLPGFKFEAKIPYTMSSEPGAQFSFVSVGFETELKIPEGQKVVVGKSHIGVGNDALILVLSARVVD